MFVYTDFIIKWIVVGHGWVVNKVGPSFIDHGVRRWHPGMRDESAKHIEC